eukprot:1156863-Pelagomonas_calceolata.AAC.10
MKASCATEHVLMLLQPAGDGFCCHGKSFGHGRSQNLSYKEAKNALGSCASPHISPRVLGSISLTPHPPPSVPAVSSPSAWVSLLDSEAQDIFELAKLVKRRQELHRAITQAHALLTCAWVNLLDSEAQDDGEGVTHALEGHCAQRHHTFILKALLGRKELHAQNGESQTRALEEHRAQRHHNHVLKALLGFQKLVRQARVRRKNSTSNNKRPHQNQQQSKLCALSAQRACVHQSAQQGIREVLLHTQRFCMRGQNEHGQHAQDGGAQPGATQLANECNLPCTPLVKENHPATLNIRIHVSPARLNPEKALELMLPA